MTRAEGKAFAIFSSGAYTFILPGEAENKTFAINWLFQTRIDDFEHSCITRAQS